MFVEILIFLILILVTLYYAVLHKKRKLNVMQDYKIIKEAYKKYKKEKGIENFDIKELNNYLKRGEKINWNRYEITKDKTFLVVTGVKEKDIKEITKEIKLPYKIKEEKIYISFMSNNSSVEPVAVITMIPMEGILTTTVIKWNCNHSICEGNKINKVEWENKKDRYEEEGAYRVGLRIQDKNGNWSEWTFIQFDVKEIKGIKDMVSGEKSIYIIQNNGKVKGMGDNLNGQLGIETNNTPHKFVESEKMKNVFQLSSGKDHTLFLTHDRKIYGIGRNHKGQLGTGDEVNRYTPTEIKGVPSPTQVCAGKDFSAAVSAQGNVYIWGNNKEGQLGDLDIGHRVLPYKLKNVKNVKRISLGESHGLALCYDGTIIAWGGNNHGQLGNGIKEKYSEPVVTTNIHNADYVWAGKGYSFAITKDGSLYGWGRSHLAQLGLEGSSNILFPQLISNMKNVECVKSHNFFVLALKKDGTVWTWGTYDFKEEIKNTIILPEKIKDIKYVKKITLSSDKAFVLTSEDEIISWDKTMVKKPIPF